MELTPQQKQQLIDYVELAKYENSSYVFGPGSRKDFHNLYQILNIIGAGYYAEYVDRKAVNDDKAPILVYVTYSQADKLLKTASAITGRTYENLTKGNFVKPVVETYSPIIELVKPAEKPPENKKKDKPAKYKNGFDFGSLLK